MVKSFLYQFGIELRLYFRNKMALLYGYLFPTIFLVAFWVLYRHELVPLVRHMGELLTVTALGGACFGLPTAMVSERERGVWRRYRVAPVSTFRVVSTTVAARYVLLISAALLQIVLALAIGMPMPELLFDLWLAFTFVSFAFLGLGLVIAMLADNVPAVQALGQSIFLPMLIIGGVAVRLQSLPAWAQHVSAFFPGRYAVQALQACVDGPGLGAARFSVLALLLVGAAGVLAGAKLFRWDAHERFVTRGGKTWLGVALAAWVAVGVLAEVSGRIDVTGPAVAEAARPAVTRSPALSDTTAQPPGDAGSMLQPSEEEQAAAETPDTPAETAGDAGERAGVETADTGDNTSEAGPPDTVAASAAPTSPDAARSGPPDTWEEVTPADVDRDIRFSRLPYDEGLIAPIAGTDEPVYPDVKGTMDCMREKLLEWPPAAVRDPVQRARNVLYLAAVPDVFQMDGLERWVPLTVFDHLKNDMPEDRLIKVLYWIATHPEEGDVSAAGKLQDVCLAVSAPHDVEMLRERTMFYASKLLGRLTGAIESK